jgi:quinol monooxygenase YgiN
MQRVTLVRYTTRPGQGDENEVLSRAVFEALRAARPAHISYSLFRAGDDFSHLFINSANDDAEPLTELPSFKAYVADIASRCVAPPAVIRIDAELLESYGLA